MGSDKAFFATILALFALFTGHPGWAFLIFLLGVFGS
jgi:hypothetical protein